jgi:hypothetical protein
LAASAEVIYKGTALPEVTEDIDRQRLGAKPDIGADEWTTPSKE